MTDAPHAPPANRLRWQTATIARIAQRTSRIKSYWLTLPEPFEFKPGQHVDVRLTAEDGYQAEGSYSIASAPEARDHIELAVECLEEGEVSPYFHDQAAVGDQFEVRGPIGEHFIWSVSDPSPVLFIAGGSGVVPMMSMLRHRAACGSNTQVAMLLSASRWDEALFRDELIALERERDGLALSFAITREAARRPEDFARRVDAAMLSQLTARLPSPPQATFVCGSNGFVETAAQAAIAMGVPAQSIRTERYG